MPEVVKPRRIYHSPRRQEQARATRGSILDAARSLFVDRGYVATTIDAIAGRANVSPESIYATFGTKRALLSALVDASIAGGDEAAPVLEQAWVKDIREEPDLRRRLRIVARNGRRILERRAAVDEIVRSARAADPEIAELWERGKSERFAGQRMLLQLVLGEKAAPESSAFGTAVDVMYAVGSPETYHLLVVDRGWSASRFERWYRDTLELLLLRAVGQSDP